ncbi:hypothetical protein B0H14DRAFT_2559287 [Mycena olivaceomarginata]|nr:hypothetical protein B0H14DRAFT_2559287 [Mycena olivaceomarginata]
MYKASPPHGQRACIESRQDAQEQWWKWKGEDRTTLNILAQRVFGHWEKNWPIILREELVLVIQVSGTSEQSHRNPRGVGLALQASTYTPTQPPTTFDAGGEQMSYLVAQEKPQSGEKKLARKSERFFGDFRGMGNITELTQMAELKESICTIGPNRLQLTAKMIQVEWTSELTSIGYTLRNSSQVAKPPSELVEEGAAKEHADRKGRRSLGFETHATSFVVWFKTTAMGHAFAPQR